MTENTSFPQDILWFIFGVLFLYFFVRIIRREQSKRNYKPGEVIASAEGLMGAMVLPKNMPQLVNFLMRFFLPSGVMNTIGSIFYWLVLGGLTTFFPFVVRLNTVLETNPDYILTWSYFLVPIIIITLPVIVMIFSAIYRYSHSK